LHTNFTFFFSFWGTSSPKPSGRVPTMRTPSIVKSWVRRTARNKQTKRQRRRLLSVLESKRNVCSHSPEGGGPPAGR